MPDRLGYQDAFVQCRKDLKLAYKTESDERPSVTDNWGRVHRERVSSSPLRRDRTERPSGKFLGRTFVQVGHRSSGVSCAQEKIDPVHVAQVRSAAGG